MQSERASGRKDASVRGQVTVKHALGESRMMGIILKKISCVLSSSE
jgi:hypothetical protein